jgi:hypothetical protein
LVFSGPTYNLPLTSDEPSQISVLVLIGGGFFIGGDDSRADDAVLDLEDRVREASTPLSRSTGRMSVGPAK